MHTARHLQWLRIFALFGILFSAFLTYQHYLPQPASLCTVGDYFVCDLVTSPYAQVDGIFHFLALDLGLPIPLYSFPVPNAVLFFLAFLMLFFVALPTQYQQPTFGMAPSKAFFTTKILFYILAAYAVYLTYVETYLLYTLCLFCFLITLLLFGSLWLLIGLHLGAHTPTERRSSSRKQTSRRTKRRR